MPRLKLAWANAGEHHVTIVAAGVAFYIFLALVPLLAATVLTYGLVADEATVAGHIVALTEMLPEEAAALLVEQLRAVVETSSGKKGVGLIVALAIALFGGRNGAGSVITALNIAEGVPDSRSVIKANTLALLVTVGGILAIIIAFGAMSVLTLLTSYLPAGIAVAGSAAAYGVLGAILTGGAAILYRYGPARPWPRWSAVLPGAVLASAGWVALTLGFGAYVAGFANYNATYGSLSAVVVLLTWLYLSAFVLLFGAELNAAGRTRSDRAAARDGT